jgi:pimeloyl-ACP methyl ester carboxylesterase
MDRRQPESLSVPANELTHRVWAWRTSSRPGAATDARLLVVVHGITSSGRGWDFVCRELAAERTVYAVDLRGHGETDKPEHGFRIADFARDLAGLIAALGIAPAVVLGHSLGALASAHLAAEWPDLVDRLILVDPPDYRGRTLDLQRVV